MLDRNISRAGHWRVVSRLFGCAAALALMPGFSPAFATDLTEAVSTAITENPTIGQAVENRRATREELNQARGFYLPRIDLDASVGTVMRDNDTTRFYGRDDEWSESHQIGITAQQLLFDGFATDSEVERQTARTDAAAFRVLERTELIGLDVAEAYLDVLRNLEVTGIAAKNIAFQEDTIGTIKRLVQGGVSPRADLQQGQERLESARVLAVDVNRSLEQARNKYRTLVGAAPEGLTLPVSAAAALPATIDDALGLAASNSPTLKLNRADVETAQAEYKAADSRFYPKLNLELSGRTGENLDGEDSGRDSELRAQLVMRYNLYNGGIDVANRQEQMHRQVESEKKLASAQRDVEELMRNAWNTLERAREQTALLERQERVSSELLASYQAEYKVGRRALLDILDAQNELIITRIDLSTSRHALLLAEFRVLAVAGKLMEHLNVAVPAEALPVSAEK